MARRLTDTVRTVLQNKQAQLVPASYTLAACDALDLLLPAIRARREGLPCKLLSPPHPLVDMLRTVDAFRRWRPDSGALCMHIADLRGAHPELRSTLVQCARVGVPGVCMRLRGRVVPDARVEPSLARTKQVVTFVIDRVAMLQLFGRVS